MTALETAFGPEGPLARELRGFSPRRAQVEMARATAAAIEQGGNLVAEAGTGTGKTLAYLVPALLSDKKVIISTATKTLQDQLFHKDLPVVRHALARPIRTALLKGRGNYLCLYRLENNLGFRAGQDARDARALGLIRRWARATRTGDIAEAHDIPEQSPYWAAATSTVDNCLGQDCPRYGDCFLVKARNRAREADALVINHHLLWADWTLRNEGFGELLPQAEVIIVDEAHQFLESAAQFLGAAISSRQLLELANDIVIERLREAPDATALVAAAEKLEHLADAARLTLGVDARREAWHAVATDTGVGDAFTALSEQLQALESQLRGQAVRGKGLESCHKRCQDLQLRLQAFFEGDREQHIRWFETRKRGFSLNQTPLEIAETFTRFRNLTRAAWIFASATLTVAGNFDHFTRRLGLSGARCLAWDSPFDYARQCLLYLPPDLPVPGSPRYTAAVLEATLPVLRASQGRAFMLFTSHQALNEAARGLSDHGAYPLFVQGAQPKTRLLEAFKASDHGVLLGTATFWEGVDVPGPTLSCVIIDKLPFASPSDPVLSARLESLREAGVNPFPAHQLPAAIIALKQGAGRLIRHPDDRGVLMLCDPRLLAKSYGRLFLDSLPRIPRTRKVEDVERFFAHEGRGVSE
jgi:ATP-dependent DNA helicase DinG